MHFGASLHPAIERARDEVVPPRLLVTRRRVTAVLQVVQPMFEDIVIDQQCLLDSPATWGKVLDLVPDANQKVMVVFFGVTFGRRFDSSPQAAIEQKWHSAQDGRERCVCAALFVHTSRRHDSLQVANFEGRDVQKAQRCRPNHVQACELRARRYAHTCVTCCVARCTRVSTFT